MSDVASTMSWIKVDMPKPQPVPNRPTPTREITGSDVMRKSVVVRKQRRAKNRMARASRRRNRD